MRARCGPPAVTDRPASSPLTFSVLPPRALQTRVLLLRSGAPPPPPPPGRRASRSRELSALAAEPRGADGADADGSADGASSDLVGFASFRFVTQETLRIVYLFELQLEQAYRRRGLGTALLHAVRQSGLTASRQGLLLTVHVRRRHHPSGARQGKGREGGGMCWPLPIRGQLGACACACAWEGKAGACADLCPSGANWVGGRACH